MPINKTWHEANKMLKDASLEERLKWHVDHARECACRPIPPKLQAEIKKRKGG